MRYETCHLEGQNVVGIIYVMFAITLLVVVFSIVVLSKRKGGNAATDTDDVFSISGNQLTVLAGIPAIYEIDEIERITFSIIVGRHSAYSGVMRIVKTNGKKSRPFLFDGSAYKKKLTLKSTKQDINLATQYLMDELRQYNICCSHSMHE